MASKFITNEGKQKLLRLGFLGDNNDSAFNYVALGLEGSTASQTGDRNHFIEATQDGYERAELVEEKNQSIDGSSTSGPSIIVSAVFDKTNFNPSADEYVTEIAIVDHDIDSGTNDIFFAFASVPKINKSHNVSLKYTIVLELKDIED